MKKTTFVMGLAALLAMATTAAIADNHGAGHMRGEHMERMVEDLGTDARTAKSAT
ncbi:MAG: hypothetical protein ACFHHU_14505 [Porticoccaceae bacterium]